MARKRRSVPMELPHSGHRAGLGDVLAEERQGLRRRRRRGRAVDARMRSSRPESVCMRTTTSSISASSSSVAWTTRSGPSATIVEVVVGDERGDLDDDVSAGIEAGHLQVHPREHRGATVAATYIVGPAVASVLQIPVRRLDPDLPLPSYAHPGDAGADLVAREDAVLAAGGGRALVPTGVAIALPDGMGRLRAAPLRPGAAPRRHRAQQPRPHRRRLPRRAQGHPGQHRPRPPTTRCTGATASPSW